MRSDNPLPRQLEIAAETIRLGANGVLPACAVSGPAGIGKTRLAGDVLRSLRAPFEIVRGTGPALELAYWRMKKGGAVVLDDADLLVMAGGTTQINRLKQLTTPGTPRVIINDTLKARENIRKAEDKRDPNIPPPRFETRANTIWLTNLDWSAADAELAPHLDALRDRGLQPVVLSHNRVHVLDYVLHLITGKHLLRGMGTLAQVQDVVDWICRYGYRAEVMSIRLPQLAMQMRVNSSHRWTEMLEPYLLDKPVVPDRPPEPPKVAPLVHRPANSARPAAPTPAKPGSATSAKKPGSATSAKTPWPPSMDPDEAMALANKLLLGFVPSAPATRTPRGRRPSPA